MRPSAGSEDPAYVRARRTCEHALRNPVDLTLRCGDTPASLMTQIGRTTSPSDDRSRGRHASTAHARASAHWRVARAILAIYGGPYAAVIPPVAYHKPFLGHPRRPGL